MAIFQVLLEMADPIRIDRVHGAVGPKPADPSRFWDMVFRLHHYPQEAIMKRALTRGPLQYAGADPS